VAKAEAKPEEVTEDDKLFWAYVAEEERPTTLYHIVDDDDDDEEEVDELSDPPEWSDNDN
jgi:hypothetical protein